MLHRDNLKFLRRALQVEEKGVRPIDVEARDLEAQSVRQFFRLLARRGHIPADPAADLPCLPEDEKPPQALTDDQIRRLLRVINTSRSPACATTPFFGRNKFALGK